MSRPECDKHGSEYMIHEDQQMPDYWQCLKCEAPELFEKPEIIKKLSQNTEALDEEIDTIGSVPLRKIIELAIEKVEEE